MEKGEGRQGKSCPFSLRCYTAQGLKWRTEHPRPPTTSSITQPIYWGYPTCNPSTAAAAAAKSLQSCPTLCDPIDGSPPGSPVPGILQARILEWVAISLPVPKSPGTFVNATSEDLLQIYRFRFSGRWCPGNGILTNTLDVSDSSQDLETALGDQ